MCKLVFQEDELNGMDGRLMQSLSFSFSLFSFILSGEIFLEGWMKR